jgi:Xaa-Pro aminopeptidase
MKIKELQLVLKKKKCDMALFYNHESPNPNMQYMTGYTGIGILVVPKNKTPFLIAPGMELERAKKSGLKTYSMDKKRFFESAYDIIKKQSRLRNVAIDNTNFNINSYNALKKQFKCKTTDIFQDCVKLRETKTEKEVEYLRKSCNFADKILQKTLKNFKEFKTESDVSAYLAYETQRLGLELSFPSIVASGKNGSMPHYTPQNKKLNKGLCVIDFGVKYKGYCSDMTRTISVGKPSPKEKEMYDMLLGIQEGCIALVKDKIKCHELYDYTVKGLGKYAKNFTHGLGHGVGIEIHEMPNLKMNSQDLIVNNKVFTIEPGVYFPGKFGIRIEDTILFKGKTQVLTKTTKELLTL